MSIITFHGADHKCGTSMVAQSVAEKIAADHPDCSVLLVHTEAQAGIEYSPFVSESMERIRPYMSGRVIDTDEIVERAKVSRNLSIIGGSENPECSWDYHPDMAAFFLSAVKNSYDVIICDSGSEIGHGLALGSLMSAELCCLVLTQCESALRRFEWQRTLFERLSVTFDTYVINNYERSGMFGKGDITVRLSAENSRVCTVRRSPFGECAELDRKTLLQYRDSGYARDITRLAEVFFR